MEAHRITHKLHYSSIVKLNKLPMNKNLCEMFLKEETVSICINLLCMQYFYYVFPFLSQELFPSKEEVSTAFT